MPLLFVTDDTKLRDIKQHVSKRPRPKRRKVKSNANTISVSVKGQTGRQSQTAVVAGATAASIVANGEQKKHAQCRRGQNRVLPDVTWLTLISASRSQDSQLSLMAYPGNTLDPFGTTLISKYQFLPTIIAFQWACPSPVAFNPWPKQSPKALQGGRSIIEACMTDEVQLWSFAATVSAMMRVCQGDEYPEKLLSMPSRHWLRYHTVKGIRERVEELNQESDVDALLLLAMFRMYIYSLAEKRYDDARLHMRAFQKLGANLHGDCILDEFCHARLKWGDMNLALETLTAPEFVPAVKPLPSHKLELVESSLSSSDRGMGLAFSSLNRYVSPRLAATIRDICQWSQVHNHVSACTQAEDTDVEWLSSRGNVLLSTLLSQTTVSNATAQSDMNRQIAKSIRVTIIGWLSFFVSHPLRGRYPDMILSHLRNASSWVLMPGSSQFEEPLCSLSLWILFIGACLEDGASDKSRTFKETLGTVLPVSHVRGKDHFASVMKQYFYSEEVQHESLERIWTSIDVN